MLNGGIWVMSFFLFVFFFECKFFQFQTHQHHFCSKETLQFLMNRSYTKNVRTIYESQFPTKLHICLLSYLILADEYHL